MKPADRLTIVHGGLLLFALALIGREIKVQLIDGEEWAARARRQHFSPSALPAVRGPILDATGATLVESRERTRISVAPPEVRDIDVVIRGLARAGVPRPVTDRIKDPRRRWVDVPGSFAPADVAPLVAMRGVYAEPVVDRVYSQIAGIRRLVGRLDARGNPLDGLELALDSLLRGDSARTRVPRDRYGRLLASAAAALPHPGATVVTTLNRTLQEIADRALATAIDSLDASGGDIVVLGPHTGEVFAMVSRRSDPAAVANTGVTEPFEPGSTLKPFVAAALLARGRARADEIIPTHDGVLQVEGRTIHDVHKEARMSLADVIRFSSNVGIVQFGERLTAREKYELYRDLGFGTVTGVPLPAEAAGTLREPRQWSRQTSASLAMGYELAVTPLQLAAAYATLANGGVLVQPHIVKEIRDPGGEVLYRAAPRTVRRVFPPQAARAAMTMLLGVVESGTAIKADLANFSVGGKSGTARRVQAGRGYVPGRYTASFVGVFPGNDPQYVIVVKIDDPTSAIYGGETAAPVTRIVLEAALAARDAALDRRALADASRATLDSFVRATRVGDPAPTNTPPSPPAVAPATLTAADTVDVPVPRAPRAARGVAPPPSRRVFSLPFERAAPARPEPPPPRAVPDVTGLPVREAVRALHAAGFRVVVQRGAARAAEPAAGTFVPPGAVVRLTVEQ